MSDPALDLFDPLVSRWFAEEFGSPTDIQRRAWPPIISGEHVLLCAPTGSGKTLTAFLWAINQLVTGIWEGGKTHVLYVSPLKALNTDIRHNLLDPLSAIRQVFEEEGRRFPDIRVQTRSGDTPQTDRRRMLRHPPEILITTPESLNLMLSSQGGRSILQSLSTVILDEIHTVVNSKRGVHLITAVDRLVPLSGEFQRIAISATVKPMSKVAEFVAGLRLEGDIHTPEYVPRNMTLIRSKAAKAYDLNVRFPEEGSEPRFGETFWKPLVREFRDIIQKNRSTLFFVRSRRLSREQFDLVLNMLAGRYAETRVRELKPRVSIDRLDNTVAARKGALLHLYISGGTIPDRGYYHLRHEETSALIGELDEEFVWEASVGQTFTFGTQNWKIRRITHNDVLVTQAPPKTLETPFWKGEVSNRDFHLAKKISEFLEEADARLDDAEWLEELQAEYRLTPMAAAHLKDYLAKQKKVTESPLPHRRNILIEHIQTGPGGVPGNQVVIHTFWGGRVNRPFALALDAAWEEQFGHRLEIFPGDESIVLQLPDPASAADLFSLITPENLEDYLRKRLESSGFFGARFRENAGRALLLTKRRLNERMPLWMSRLRSQKLLQSVMSLTDFPVLLETWRTCLQDEFDLDALRQVLREVASGTIRISECTTSHPSPMAQGLTWAQINQYMYAADGLPADRTSRLRTDLLREVVFSPGLRPVIPEKIIQEFEAKRQRIHPGYAPGSGRELVDWVKERVLIPWEEWQSLERAIHRDRADADQPPEENPLEEAGAKLVRLEIKDTGTFVVATLERLPGIQESLFGSCPSNWMLLKPSEARPALTGAEEVSASEQDILFTSLLGEWFQFYGPLAPADIGARLGLEPSRLQLALEDLKDAEALITGRLTQDAEADTVCDAENFEILLRMARAAAAPQVQAREISELQAFLAAMQELVSPREGADGLFQALERLVGYPVPARLWESEVLPARIPGYTADWLDSLLRQGALRWQGDKERRVRFFFEEDAALLPAAPNENTDENGSGTEEQKADSVASLFSDPSARYDFSVLLSRSGQRIRILEDRLWEGVWQGRISNDTFSAMRRGLDNDFRVADAVERQQKALRAHGHRGRRLHLSRWKESQPYPGSWFLLPEPSQEDREDLIELEESRKDRVRILLDRYGILFREILHREQLLFRWPDVFRTLRLMELSGEVLAGLFFKGISGPQFMSHRAFRFFQQELSKEAVYWMNALDPASLCGIPLEGMRGSLPKRIEGNHVVFRGKDPVLISQRKGGQLTFRMPPDDPRLGEYLVILQHLLNREFSPQRRLIVESINGDPAPQSPYLPALQAGFDTVVDIKHVSLYRRAKS